MSEHVNGTHRDQTVLFPDTIDKYVEKENPARFIDAFVDSLSLEKLGFRCLGPIPFFFKVFSIMLCFKRVCNRF